VLCGSFRALLNVPTAVIAAVIVFILFSYCYQMFHLKNVKEGKLQKKSKPFVLDSYFNENCNKTSNESSDFI
jgi:hypothetical protein